MKYVRLLPDSNWEIITPEQEDNEYLIENNIFKLVEHEVLGNWDPTLWKYVDHLQLQEKLRILHRFHRLSPIDAYEPPRPTIIDTSI
jgi:hypothetical protein